MVQGVAPTSHGCCAACVDKLLGHKYETHAPGTCPSDGAHCNICDGGLAACTVCGGAEGTLTKHCPGAQITALQSERIYAGTLDYVGGKWVDKVPK